MSFVLAGAALRGPGPLPRALGGSRKVGRHFRCRLCWQTRHLGVLGRCRARVRELAKRWQARYRCHLCWQERHLGALGRCRARALASAALRGPGPLPRARSGGSRNVGRRDTGAAGAALRGPGSLPRARSGTHIYTHTHTQSHTRPHTHTHPPTPTHTHTHPHTHTHTHRHTHTETHRHTHTHTQTHTDNTLTQTGFFESKNETIGNKNQTTRIK